LQDNTVTPVPDQVVFRLDWPAWLKTAARYRQIIKDMGRNERTQDIAPSIISARHGSVSSVASSTMTGSASPSDPQDV